MKTRLVVFVILISLVSACKKNKSSGTADTNQSFTPVYVAPTQPGILQVSQSALMLHTSSSATVTAQIFNSDGTLQTTPPTLTWVSDNTSIATVSNGVITAVGSGNATISVTDGSHGYEYVSVSVVSDSTTISSGAAFISFSTPIAVLAKGASQTFTYSIRNASGHTITGSPVFYSPGAAGISVSGTSVTVGSVTGDFYLFAVIGTDTLRGSMELVVYDPQNTASDTTWHISKTIRYPIIFNNNGLTADPIVIQVTQIVRNGASHRISKFQTSPDNISIAHDAVITSSSGRIKSVGPGWSAVTLTYKGQTASGYSRVLFNLNGSWGGNWDNGSKFSICITYPDAIGYGGYGFVPSTVSEVIADPCAGTLQNGYFGVVPEAVLPTFNGLYYSPSANGNPGWWWPATDFADGPIHVGQYVMSTADPNPANHSYSGYGCMNIVKSFDYQDANHVKSGNVILTRGAGNCTGTTTPSNSTMTCIINGVTYTTDSCLCFFSGLDTMAVYGIFRTNIVLGGNTYYSPNIITFGAGSLSALTTGVIYSLFDTTIGGDAYEYGGNIADSLGNDDAPARSKVILQSISPSYVSGSYTITFTDGIMTGDFNVRR